MRSVDSPPVADESVLSTLNRDGTRRWLRPRISPGRFLEARRWFAYFLIVLFTALPYVRIRGKPSILLDLPDREFTFFGTTLLPTDSLLLALLLLAVFITIFLLTALFGRVWCGWGCPQTVYMEFVYRPLERLFEKRHYKTGGRAAANPGLRILKYAVYLIVSIVLAHTFLAYFVGVDRLLVWVRRSPFDHPASFLIMAATTTLMMFDFCYFREQVCTLMCPYGRFQSVLLDRQSLIISYDERRGEPRSKGKRKADDGHGDCIDCGLCVATCPTGIDIRAGLQMECIGCAQCIDACDSVMDRVGFARGLIRYGSQQGMEENRARLLRPRVVVYPLVLAVVVGLFGMTLAGRDDADISFLRNRARPYRLLDSGDVSNVVMVKIVNRADETRSFDVSVVEEAAVSSADLPLILPAGEAGLITLHVVLPRDRFVRGRAEITLRVADDGDFSKELRYQALGPLFGGPARREPS